MKRTTCIRLVCILTAVGCCGAYGGGYYHSLEQARKDQQQEQFSHQESAEPLEPATAVVSPYEFLIKEEEGYLIVYCADGETLYEITDIPMSELPLKLQREIREGKQIYDQQELYHFLESYSS